MNCFHFSHVTWRAPPRPLEPSARGKEWGTSCSHCSRETVGGSHAHNLNWPKWRKYVLGYLVVMARADGGRTGKAQWEALLLCAQGALGTQRAEDENRGPDNSVRWQHETASSPGEGNPAHVDFRKIILWVQFQRLSLRKLLFVLRKCVLRRSYRPKAPWRWKNHILTLWQSPWGDSSVGTKHPRDYFAWLRSRNTLQGLLYLSPMCQPDPISHALGIVCLCISGSSKMPCGKQGTRVKIHGLVCCTYIVPQFKK